MRRGLVGGGLIQVVGGRCRGSGERGGGRRGGGDGGDGREAGEVAGG